MRNVEETTWTPRFLHDFSCYSCHFSISPAPCCSDCSDCFDRKSPRRGSAVHRQVPRPGTPRGHEATRPWRHPMWKSRVTHVTHVRHVRHVHLASLKLFTEHFILKILSRRRLPVVHLLDGRSLVLHRAIWPLKPCEAWSHVRHVRHQSSKWKETGWKCWKFLDK